MFPQGEGNSPVTCAEASQAAEAASLDVGSEAVTVSCWMSLSRAPAFPCGCVGFSTLVIDPCSWCLRLLERLGKSVLVEEFTLPSRTEPDTQISFCKGRKLSSGLLSLRLPQGADGS